MAHIASAKSVADAQHRIRWNLIVVVSTENTTAKVVKKNTNHLKNQIKFYSLYMFTNLTRSSYRQTACLWYKQIASHIRTRFVWFCGRMPGSRIDEICVCWLRGLCFKKSKPRRVCLAINALKHNQTFMQADCGVLHASVCIQISIKVRQITSVFLWVACVTPNEINI